MHLNHYIYKWSNFDIKTNVIILLFQLLKNLFTEKKKKK